MSTLSLNIQFRYIIVIQTKYKVIASGSKGKIKSKEWNDGEELVKERGSNNLKK